MAKVDFRNEAISGELLATSCARRKSGNEVGDIPDATSDRPGYPISLTTIFNWASCGIYCFSSPDSFVVQGGGQFCSRFKLGATHQLYVFHAYPSLISQIV
jgi:hypothetical protein